jgi:HAD superfamily hydrolase (TIGR01457 family)
MKRIENKLKAIKCFVLDLDGTFYLGGRVIPGALEFIGRVESTGRRYVFLTNNSSKSAAEYLEKLSGMGLKAAESQLVTSGGATINYLHRHHAGKSAFLLGTPALREEFAAAGIRLADDAPDLAVTAFDTTLDYEKLSKLCGFVRAGLPYIATHPDYNCPTESGYIPDIGAVHAFVNASTGRMPDMIVGKPNRGIIDFACAKAGCKPEEAAIIGDRLYTDIACAKNVPGLTSVLVLTGETKMEELKSSPIKPDMVFESLKEITAFIA